MFVICIPAFPTWATRIVVLIRGTIMLILSRNWGRSDNIFGKKFEWCFRFWCMGIFPNIADSDTKIVWFLVVSEKLTD